jgi:hypothetical protein
LGLASAEAAPPLWKQLAPRKRVAAAAGADYALSQENGPWLILATSFEGPEGEAEARELVLDLRQNHNLPAFYYAMTFQLESARPGLGIDAAGAPIKRRYQRGNEVLQHAVLVGEFASVDDPAAQDLLEQVKVIKPKSLEVAEGEETSQALAAVRDFYTRVKEQAGRKVYRGPLGHAFLTPNPLLPKEYFAPAGIEPDVAQWNKGLEHSLLECPGKYSVRVATFRGRTLLKEAQTEAAAHASIRQADEKDPLVIAARNAHDLTVALRSRGWEAYQMHDRHESYVTVGSFNEAERLPDGRIVLPQRDAQIIIATFGATSPQNVLEQPVNQAREEAAKQQFKQLLSAGYGQVAEGFHPKRFVGLPMDIHPQAVEVPKQTISASLARNP